jgi:hypothetical protein
VVLCCILFSFSSARCALTAPSQDALSDRDLVHRQTAAAVVQHMSMGVPGLGCEDALLHLLNYVWPNVFEDSPHLINGVMGAIDGCRLSLGPCVVLHYTLQVRGLGTARCSGCWQSGYCGRSQLRVRSGSNNGITS